jgi:hypothetical protein
LAVAVLMERWAAISPLDRPAPTSVSTSRSRSVTPSSARVRRWLGPPGELLDQASGDARGDERVAGGDDTDGGEDVVEGHVLDEEPAGAGAQ